MRPDRDINDLIRSSIDDASRRLHVDRRRFLQSAGAVAAALAAFELAGCSPVRRRIWQSSEAIDDRRVGVERFTCPDPEDTAACQTP